MKNHSFPPLGMVVGRAAVGDTQTIQSFDITRRRKLRAVVGRQSQTHSTRTERQNLQHGADTRKLLPGSKKPLRNRSDLPPVSVHVRIRGAADVRPDAFVLVDYKISDSTHKGRQRSRLTSLAPLLQLFP